MQGRHHSPRQYQRGLHAQRQRHPLPTLAERTATNVNINSSDALSMQYLSVPSNLNPQLLLNTELQELPPPSYEISSRYPKAEDDEEPPPYETAQEN